MLWYLAKVLLHCLNLQFSTHMHIIGKNKKNTIVGVIYRKPSSNLNDFINLIDSVLNVINIKSKTCFIMGDFNVDILQCNQCNMIQNYFFYLFFPIINEPTCVILLLPLLLTIFLLIRSIIILFQVSFSQTWVTIILYFICLLL